MQFRTDDEGTWTSYACAIIPPDLPHAFQAPGKRVAQIFCEPESALGRLLLDQFESGAIASLPRAGIALHASALEGRLDEGGSDEDLEQLALDTLFALAGTLPAKAADARVGNAIAAMGARLADRLTLEEIALEVGLSPGRFRHLFVEQTGIPFRLYLLWARLNRALELGFGGTSWTEAAHATNFADSAHLSRTCRRMYGLSPSSIHQEAPAIARQMTA